MGKHFADFFKERGITIMISDLGTKVSNEEVALKADVVIVSVPMPKAASVITSLLPYMPSSSLLIDFCSIKNVAAEALAKAKCETLPMHPMFGDSNPIPGQTVILCPSKRAGKWTKWLEKFLKDNKVIIRKISVRDHDKAMSITQSLIHFADITFADALRQSKVPVRELFKLASKASELKVQLAARLLDQDPGLYAQIQIQNPQTLKPLKEYKKSIEKLIRIIEKKDIKKFEKYFEDNRKFLKNYTGEAYKDSSYLIDKLVELQKNRQVMSTQKIKAKLEDLAVLGPKNTYSDLAATKYNSDAPKYYAKSIDEVLELVAKGEVVEGILPIENKLHGTIRETLDGLFYKNIHIVREISLPIHHTLIILKQANKADIKRIISHSQALNQCKKYLKHNFPKAIYEPFSSTAASLQKMIDEGDKAIAVIAPETSLSKDQLKVYARNIEDEKDNSTSFLVIRKGPAKATSSSKKTSIAFHFSKDSPGSLFAVFKDFADAKINLTKIESRPTKASFGDYIFYLDFEGSIKAPNISKTLSKVKSKVARLKILGSY